MKQLKIGKLAFSIIGIFLGILIGVFVGNTRDGASKASIPENSPNSQIVKNHGLEPSISPNRKKPRQADQANEKPWEKNPIQNLVEIRKKERPRFQLMDDEGFVTSQAIEAHGLNDIQVAELKAATVAMRTSIREQLMKNIVKDDERSKPGSAAYRIKPFSDEGNRIIGRFLEDVSRSVGESAAWDLAKAIPVERSAGGFGLYEVILSVNEPAAEQVMGMSDSDVKKLNSVVCEYRDAETGKKVSGSVSSLSSFNGHFFDLFE
jgi:hypothetical protein